MKIIGLCVGLLIGFGACQSHRDTVVGIRAEGIPVPEKVVLSISDSTYEIFPDSLGIVRFVLPPGIKGSYASCRWGKLLIPLYLEQGKNLAITLGNERTPVFEGQGAKENEYLNSELFRQVSLNNELEEDQFIGEVKVLEQKLSAYLKEKHLDAAFTDTESKRLHYWVCTLWLQYITPYHRPSDSFYEQLEKAVQEDTALMELPEYRKAWKGLVEVMAMKDLWTRDPYEIVGKQLAYLDERIEDPALSGYLTDEIIVTYIRKYGIAEAGELLPLYRAKVREASKVKALEKLYSKWARIAPGQLSPDFACPDLSGKVVGLSDLKGKYVYIDVWATWCGPCCAEIPHLQKLEQKFATRNIAFVSISCDRNKEAWKKMIGEKQLGGIQLNGGENSDFMKAYMIRGIPRFILLDREGKILDADMSSPSDPRTAGVLEALEGM